MKRFFDKHSILSLIDDAIESRLFKPIAISIIASFLMFNGFSYLKNYIEDRREISRKVQESNPIKINISHPNSKFDFDEEQIVEYRVKSGDTILKILLDIGANDSDSSAILNEIKKIYNPRNIYNGQRIFIKYRVNIDYKKDENNTDNVKKSVVIHNISIPSAAEKEILITRLDSGDYKAKENVKKLIKYIVKYQGTIRNGLFADGADAGVSPTIMMNMVNLYSYDVDFQRDIRSGDKFEMLFESFYDEGGKRIKDGDLLFSSLTLQRRTIDMYMYGIGNQAEYFDAKGNSVRKSLLKTPINGARISSGFGVRRHPVLGYSRMHKGIDFAAPSGTPIFAAGAGVITYYGRKGGYGNFTQIRHNAEYSTAYGHASRYVKGLHVGSRVKQGQVVAYVGSTGRSTGPHLHYEIMYKGQAMNPAKVKTTSGIKLSGRELAKFEAVRNNIEKHRKNTPNQSHF